MTSCPLLQILNGEKRYGNRIVLKVDDFSLYHRDLVFLKGDNGSGKSTMLRALAGVMPLSRGRVLYSSKMRNMRVGYVPQSGGIYDDFTVRQNLEVYARLYGTSTISSPTAHWFIQDSALIDLLETPVSHLSGGIKKLAVLACVLAVDPNGLILDEPTTELDERHGKHFYKAIERLSQSLSFLVMSSHEESYSAFLSRRVTMHEGRLT